MVEIADPPCPVPPGEGGPTPGIHSTPKEIRLRLPTEAVAAFPQVNGCCSLLH
jgi:hypothetical protein